MEKTATEIVEFLRTYAAQIEADIEEGELENLLKTMWLLRGGVGVWCGLLEKMPGTLGPQK